VSDWTAAEVTRLRQLHAEGHSYTKIAAELGKTKNAISGQALRLNLPKRPGPIRQADRPAGAAPAPAAPRPHQAAKPEKWTADRRAVLRRLVPLGTDWAKVATEVNELPGEEVTVPQCRSQAQHLKLKGPAPAAATVALAPPARPVSRRTTTCQFILGPARGTATRFCDAPTLAGSSYCPAHHAVCWHPLPRRDLHA
jgi:GcrA cell cycle regulator